MSFLSQTQKIIEFLKQNPNKKFTAREIATNIVQQYAEDYKNKRNNKRFKSEKEFINQIVAEIGAQKEQLIKTNSHIFWKDKPRPRVYWYDPNNRVDNTNKQVTDIEEYNTLNISSKSSDKLSEHDLYPILMSYLHSEHKLYCKRINEKTSKNSKGKGGNDWLHPDIVAMQAIDKEWDELVKKCVKSSNGQNVKLYSFEVKIKLDVSNVRKSFFQAVSNSSWANEGYLVATEIDSKIEQELRMLSSLHGIGVIVLNTENPSESEIYLPAKFRFEVDWESVNRIVVENSDFKDYIELVSIYYQTGTLRSKEWNK